ncbi:AceF, Pyruvate-2-oxoglutarate dehydrogenase complex [Pyrenophora tritici-repentis]|uniref:AceF, Pyruvate-2-oxoglutarate dehydrogenase complex n=1 Tax=Pyrenophora tritici-repentis TaxID=45151 RepID=A0A316ZS97_9PLEO|nr:AceF, Pyruvate-2-oxoglutarate dehydrogenase complex [Pyrenophora tritici-repentis]
MPALSPTMTEGNIATWKIKEGDSFSAGDVLLEIETDKAQMDVEAQDDGVLAKITVGDGSKAVQVGTRIAVTAEPGDDLSTLEIPAEETTPSPKKEASAPKESAPIPKEERTSAPPPAQKSTSSSGKATKQTYPLYPSVQHLLNINNLPASEADKIPATGPNGRLLKGDVLAYVGKIDNAYPSELATRFSKLSHLDLSNIKPMAKKADAPKKAAATKDTPVVEEAPVEVALPVSLTAVMECQKRVKDSIGVFLPLSTFVARATELANESLPRSKLAKPSADELFNAVLGLDKVAAKSSHGTFVPSVRSFAPALPATAARKTAAKKSDILDLLAGKKTAAKRTSPMARGATDGPLNVFSVTVPKGDERRGRVFLERVKSVLEAEPGRLVV